MRKYEEPILIEEEIELEDIVAKSGESIFNGIEPGDVEHAWPW